MPLRAHLELLHRSALPSVHEGREVVLKLPVRGQDGEHVRVGLVQQFDGMREGAVFPSLENYLSPFMDAWQGGAQDQLQVRP